MAPETPYLAAISGYGHETIARIERFRLDGTRCGLNQGRHAAWNWAYRVHVPENPPLYGDRSLAEARQIAACYAATIVEDFPGGSMFCRGRRGGIKRLDPSWHPIIRAKMGVWS